MGKKEKINKKEEEPSHTESTKKVSTEVKAYTNMNAF